MIGDDSSEALGSLIWRLQVGFYCVTWELASLVAFGGSCLEQEVSCGSRLDLLCRLEAAKYTRSSGLLWQQVVPVVQAGALVQVGGSC